MKKWICCMLLMLVSMAAQAQYEDLLSAKKGVIPGGYDFWVYTPDDYYFTMEATPLIVFLHGASICGYNMKRVLRYGPLDAVKTGLQIPALIVAPLNHGGPWSPKKLNDMLEWVYENYPYDRSRVYVLGMSLGGYGTLDFAGTYPEKIAAAMALCGGSTLHDHLGLGEVPLWIIHGTADRAISVNESKKVVNTLKAAGKDQRLRYDWIAGASHGALARYFYTIKTYEWLLAHSLYDGGRPVFRGIDISQTELKQVYRNMQRRPNEMELEME